MDQLELPSLFGTHRPTVNGLESGASLPCWSNSIINFSWSHQTLFFYSILFVIILTLINISMLMQIDMCSSCFTWIEHRGQGTRGRRHVVDGDTIQEIIKYKTSKAHRRQMATTYLVLSSVLLALLGWIAFRKKPEGLPPRWRDETARSSISHGLMSKIKSELTNLGN